MEALILNNSSTGPTGANMAKPEALPLHILVEKFLYDQDISERSRSTYRRNLKQFFAWVKDIGLTPFELRREHVIAYKENLQGRGFSTLSLAAYLTAVKLFYSFLSRNQIYWNIAEGIKAPRRQTGPRKQPLTPEEGRSLLEYLTQQGPRFKALGAVMLYCGLRVNEVRNLSIQDLTRRRGGWILWVRGKGHHKKEQYVQVNEACLKALKEYIATRAGALPGEPMFTSTSNNNRGQSISTVTISTTIKEALRAVGLDDPTFTAHSLRHTFGTRLLDQGASLEEVAAEMRHADTSTTKIYTHAIREEIRERRRVTDLLINVFD